MRFTEVNMTWRVKKTSSKTLFVLLIRRYGVEKSNLFIFYTFWTEVDNLSSVKLISSLNTASCLERVKPHCTVQTFHYLCYIQGIGIKGKKMALVWHEEVSRTALQTSSVFLTHTLLVQTHNMTTVKKISEQCRQL